MKLTSLFRVPVLSLSVLAVALFASPVRGDAIMSWNTTADVIATDKGTGTTEHGRGLAILHLAMFEAVNAIEQRYTSYKLRLSAERGISKEAAAASAGYHVLLQLHPDQKPRLDAALTKLLAEVREGDPKAKGIELGRQAAVQMRATRANDGSDARESYRYVTQPGVYVPTAVVVSATVGGWTPWVMSSGSQLRPAPPPALQSETWTRDVNEIREMGSRNSTKRTAEQTDIGRFWFLTGARTYNPIVQQVAVAKGFDIVDNARLFALVALAGMDAYIAVFDAKYHYNFWRPITAIRNADQTGNSATPRDPSWLPLGTTPMHPEYPCAHCITSGAVSAVLQGVIGEIAGAITLTSPTAPGVTRRWIRLQDYRDEVALARIYGGFHYRFSNLVGTDMGVRIGQMAVATQLRPIALAKP
jgi:PAP2 superfamily